jgi:hypothetical protein
MFAPAVVSPSLLEATALAMLAFPGGDGNPGCGIEHAAGARLEAMARQQIFRRGVRTNFAEHRQSAWNPRIRRAREMKSVVLREKKTEHVGAADDGNDAIADSEPIKRRIKASAGGIPQQSIRVRCVRSKCRDPAGQNETLAARGSGAALVGVAAMNDDRGAIERVLEKPLIGVVADRPRHLTTAFRDHAVGGNDHIAFDAAHG